VKTLQLGPLRVHAAGGSDRDGGGDGPAVLLCHGFGAPGDDLVSLHRVIDAGPGVRWFFPEAPLGMGMGAGAIGRAWWEIDMMALQLAMQRGAQRQMETEHPAGMPAAAAALTAVIEALEADHKVTRSRLVIGGFSQGSMVTTEVALHAERPFAGLVVLSGALLCRDRWAAAAARSAPGLRVFQSHGRRDPILPFAGAEALGALLDGAGAQRTFVPFGGQHEIPYPVIEGAGAFLRATFDEGRGGA
jgi:phospholipase/carboxylesterase